MMTQRCFHRRLDPSPWRISPPSPPAAYGYAPGSGHPRPVLQRTVGCPVWTTYLSTAMLMVPGGDGTAGRYLKALGKGLGELHLPCFNLY